MKALPPNFPPAAAQLHEQQAQRDVLYFSENVLKNDNMKTFLFKQAVPS